MFCQGGMCGSGNAPLYTSDTNVPDNGFAIKNVAFEGSTAVGGNIDSSGAPYEAGQWRPVSTGDGEVITAGEPSAWRTTGESSGWRPVDTSSGNRMTGNYEEWKRDQQSTYGRPCDKIQKNRVRIADRVVEVDCPGQRVEIIPKIMPKVTTFSTPTQKIRINKVKKTRKRPVLMERYEYRMVDEEKKEYETRQVPYVTYKDVPVETFITEERVVTVPHCKTVNERRKRVTKVPRRTKCKVDIPVYGARCQRTRQVFS